MNDRLNDGVLPARLRFLTVGVDVRTDCLLYEVLGWSSGQRVESIEFGQLDGDTANLNADPWVWLDELLSHVWRQDGGAAMVIRMAAIDRGFRPLTVDNWCHQHPLNLVTAVKGQDHGGVIAARMWPRFIAIPKSELCGWPHPIPPSPDPNQLWSGARVYARAAASVAVLEGMVTA